MISSILHIILATGLTFSILFSTKISTLLLLLTGFTLMIIFNLQCGDCPVTIVEDHYSKSTSPDYATLILFGKKFDKKTRSLMTLIVVYIGYSLVLFKLAFLIALKLFIVVNHQKGTMKVII